MERRQEAGVPNVINSTSFSCTAWPLHHSATASGELVQAWCSWNSWAFYGSISPKANGKHRDIFHESGNNLSKKLLSESHGVHTVVSLLRYSPCSEVKKSYNPCLREYTSEYLTCDYQYHAFDATLNNPATWCIHNGPYCDCSKCKSKMMLRRTYQLVHWQSQ